MAVPNFRQYGGGWNLPGLVLDAGSVTPQMLKADAGNRIPTGPTAATIAAAAQTSADTGAITAASVDTSAAKLTDVQALQVDYDKMVIDMAAVVSKLNSVITALKAFGIVA